MAYSKIEKTAANAEAANGFSIGSNSAFAGVRT